MRITGLVWSGSLILLVHGHAMKLNLCDAKNVEKVKKSNLHTRLIALCLLVEDFNSNGMNAWMISQLESHVCESVWNQLRDLSVIYR